MNTPTEQFRKDWRNDEAVAAICEQLYKHVEIPENRLEHFSFSLLKKTAKTEDETRLAKAVQYLSSPKWSIFKQVFLFFDGDEVTEFSAEDVVVFLANHSFPHPRSGRVIGDLNQISVAFEVGTFFTTEQAKK